MDALILLIFVYSLEHLFYTWAWFLPDQFMALAAASKTDPCEALQIGLGINKVIQIITVITFCLVYNVTFNDDISYFYVLLSIIGVGIGQFLNYSVYKALGVNGVYYGVKFGKKVPWCTQFPFNVPWLKHPQYLGAAITHISLWFLLRFLTKISNEKDQQEFNQIIVYFQIFLTFSYSYMAYIES